MMSKRKPAFNLIGIGLAAAFILASCSPAATTAAPPSQMASPQPAASTATVPASPTGTALPTATVTGVPTLTPTLVTVAQVLPGWNAYCRRGPGTYYYAITYLQSGKPYRVVGRDGRGIWWQVQVTPNVSCWEGDPTSNLQGPVASAPILPAPPLPSSPSLFANTSHCDSVLNTMTVWLTWKPAQGITGYRIYLNGSVIAKLGPEEITYTDNAPRGVDLKYEIEAFNDYGVAPRLSTEISACL